jgi:hypothetical protein
MYQIMYKLSESRNAVPYGPLSFPSAEARDEFAKAGHVFWYHYAEWDDWHDWRRGGAWAATAAPSPADNVPAPPEITEQDRW